MTSAIDDVAVSAPAEVSVPEPAVEKKEREDLSNEPIDESLLIMVSA